MPEVPKGLESFYDQDVAWEKCSGSFDCATISVPLDYDNPSGTSIEIAMLRRPAKGEALGSLFINPGGPGGSGIDMAMSANYYFSEDIRENFDIIGFDPRGVGQSTPVDCVDDATLDRLLETSYDESDADWKQKWDADLTTITEGCSANSGELLPFVGTKYAAQDIDVMRHLVGDPKLYYAGFSYGTLLGAQYADTFPENTGRLILDGAVDSSIGSARMSYDQTLGFETAMRRYVEDCMAGTDCPFDGSVDDALAQIRDIFDASLKNPYPTDDPDRPLTQSQLFGGMILPLYDSSNWQLLTMAFSDVIKGNDGTQFQYYSDLSNEREADGTFSSNGTEANWAINCADYPPGDAKQYEEFSKELQKDAPVFGDFMTSGEDLCASWPYQPKDPPGPLNAKGSAPLVVVGTRYDPATPYHWAEAMHDQLDNSVLVSWEGDGHTAYGRADECVSKPLDAYLLNGTVPKDGLICE